MSNLCYMRCGNTILISSIFDIEMFGCLQLMGIGRFFSNQSYRSSNIAAFGDNLSNSILVLLNVAK